MYDCSSLRVQNFSVTTKILGYTKIVTRLTGLTCRSDLSISVFFIDSRGLLVNDPILRHPRPYLVLGVRSTGWLKLYSSLFYSFPVFLALCKCSHVNNLRWKRKQYFLLSLSENPLRVHPSNSYLDILMFCSPSGVFQVFM